MSGPVLILFEDKKFRGVGDLIKQALVDGHGGAPTADILDYRSVGGAQNFANDVGRYLKATIAPRSIFCLGDADAASEHLVPGTTPIVTSTDLHRSRRRWRDRLRQPHAQGGERIHAVLLRWSQESLWTTSPEALEDWSRNAVALRRHFEEHCDPDPSTFKGDFIAAYRKPQDCLDRVARAVLNRKFNKNVDNDVIAAHAIAHLPQLLERHRDFAVFIRCLRRALR